jgi:hypothetical protein
VEDFEDAFDLVCLGDNGAGKREKYMERYGLLTRAPNGHLEARALEIGSSRDAVTLAMRRQAAMPSCLPEQ